MLLNYSVLLIDSAFAACTDAMHMMLIIGSKLPGGKFVQDILLCEPFARTIMCSSALRGPLGRTAPGMQNLAPIVWR
jgi:hypothetical protein